MENDIDVSIGNARSGEINDAIEAERLLRLSQWENATLVERERCAKIAEGYYDNSALFRRAPGPTTQEGIAAAIRKGEA